MVKHRVEHDHTQDQFRYREDHVEQVLPHSYPKSRSRQAIKLDVRRSAMTLFARLPGGHRTVETIKQIPRIHQPEFGSTAIPHSLSSHSGM
jgi:hypothetical protein